MEEKFLKVIELFKEKTKKDCYAISVLEGEPTILDDKIGGKPYLPIGIDYPKDENNNFMPLLLQVNLKNIDLKGYPKQGILEIFTDKDVAYPCQYVIKYFEEGLEYQTDLPEIDTSYYITTKPLKIELTKVICHMPLSDYRFLNTIGAIASEVYGANVTNYSQLEDLFADADWYESFSKNLTNHTATIGGYADFTQTDPRCYQLKDKDECLFKLDSYFTKDINIGDMGILFVLISQADIEASIFDKAIVDWDCY